LNVNTINLTSNASRKQRAKSLTYHHGDLRNALIDAAISAISDSGRADFSLSELARKLGVTPAAAYKHFVDKDELIAACARKGFDLLTAAFEVAAPRDQKITSARTAMHRFEHIGAAYIEFGLREPALFGLMFGIDATSFRESASASGSASPSFSYLVNALNDLHRFELIAKKASTQDLWFAWSAIHGATHLIVSKTTSLVSAADAAKVVTSRILRSLG
jgi:AcrR family transcriptional regulator